MIKTNNLTNQTGKTFLVATDNTTKKAKILIFAKALKLTDKGANLLTKLLRIQKIAINGDYLTLLRKVNEMLFQINEIYRKKLILNAEKVQLDYYGAKTFELITCYNLIK